MRGRRGLGLAVWRALNDLPSPVTRGGKLGHATARSLVARGLAVLDGAPGSLLARLTDEGRAVLDGGPLTPRARADVPIGGLSVGDARSLRLAIETGSLDGVPLNLMVDVVRAWIARGRLGWVSRTPSFVQRYPGFQAAVDQVMSEIMLEGDDERR